MKILVINIKYLGDLIVSTPGLRALKETCPNAEIIFLLRKGYEDVLSGNPNINAFISFDPKLKGYSGIRSFFEGIKFIKKIRRQKFDVVISLHPGDRIAFWSWFSGAKLRIAPRKQSFNFLFNRLVDVEEDSISYLEYYNKIFSAYTGEFKSSKTEFFINAKIEDWSDNFFNSEGIWENDILIGIHPGARDPERIWKKENFKKLIELFLHKKNIKILLIEGPQDKNISYQIWPELNNLSVITYNSDNIKKTASLIKRCNLFITHDTGTRHLAVAVGTPVLALLPGDKLKTWGFYDESQNHYHLEGQKYFPKENSKESAFLDGITVNDVYKKAGEIISLW